MIKVHELTFKGGPAFYYRLGLWEQPAGTPIVRQPATQAGEFVLVAARRPCPSRRQSPESRAEQRSVARAQRISLPCDIAGRFYPGGGRGCLRVRGQEGRGVWWIEVASERFGLPTDPAILVQQV